MTTRNENNPSGLKHSSESPDSLPNTLTRRCQNCGGTMQATSQASQKNNLPWSERGTRFVCEQCEARVWIASNDTIIICIFSGLLITVGIGYMLANGFMSFVSMGFESGILWTLLSLALIAITILFAIGGVINIRRGFTHFLNKIKHPILGVAKRSNTTSISLLLGALPWLLVTTTGYINFTYFNDSAVIGAIGLALFAMPLAFANSLGASSRGVFLSMVMWFILGGLAIWIYNVW